MSSSRLIHKTHAFFHSVNPDILLKEIRGAKESPSSRCFSCLKSRNKSQSITSAFVFPRPAPTNRAALSRSHNSNFEEHAKTLRFARTLTPSVSSIEEDEDEEDEENPTVGVTWSGAGSVLI